MKTINKIVNVIGLLIGIFFLFGISSDIQFGFGCVLVLMAINNLTK